MNLKIVIACLIGFVCGIVARKSQDPLPAPVEGPPRPVSSRSSRSSSGSSSGHTSVLSWELRGDLTSDELLDLPHGARLLAEMALWSLNASPEELAEHWDKMTASGEKDMNTLDQLMVYWGRRDPHGALAHTRGSDEEYRCYWALGQTDPQLALDSVDPNHNLHLSMVLRAIGQTDPERALELLEKYPNHNSYSVTAGISDGLADFDSARAVAYSAKQEYFEERRLRWWLAKDPHVAFEWSLKNYAIAGDTVSGMIPLLMEQDPAHFAARIADLPTGKLKLDLLKAQAKHLAAEDPERAFAFADAQEGPLRQTLMEGMGSSLVGKHPEAAKGLLKALLAESGGDEAGTRTMYQDWVGDLIREDPVATLDLVREASPVSEGREFSSAESMAFDKWSKLDLAASHEWLGSQERGARLDGLLGDHLSNQRSQQNVDYERLIQLTDHFDNEEARGRSIAEMLIMWNHRNPEGLRAFMQSPKASTAQREAYQENFPKQ